MWLRAGRDRRNLTIDDVAKITKIQPRILEKLERGELDGLPAEVFVRGFVRSFAKCVGLDETVALEKYGAAQAAPLISSPAKPTTTPATVTAKALVDTLVAPKPEPEREPEPAPAAPLIEAAPVIETAPVVEAVAAVETPAAPSKKKNRGKKRGSRKNKKTSPPAIEAQSATAEAPSATVEAQSAAVEAQSPIVENAAPDSVIEAPVLASLETGPVAKIDAESIDSASIEAKTTDVFTAVSQDVADVAPATADGTVEAAPLAEGSDRISSQAIEVVDATAISADVEPAEDTAGTWQPTMPPIATSPSVPWRRPHLPTASRASSKTIQPSLLIDDADPDSADRERETRAAKELPHIRGLSFLPPILMDREDRSARQGGLTLAVILLLIAATLTLSYLMRRPSTSADGVTQLDTHGERSTFA